MSRTKSPVLWISTVVVVLAAAIGLYLFQPWRLLTTERVDEAAPVATDGQGAAQAKQVANGSFISHEHETSGSVEIQRLADGTATLRLTNLRTSDGPALHVWLSDQPVKQDGGGNLDDGKYVDLGDLKGNEGNQNYAIPQGTDLNTFSTVTIWCERFSVSFGAAELKQLT
ncbi:DM13 domain-containing protein [Streptomyces sp. NBC_01619]|uniref:DM13 domain-containing protein n=1 Tax=unclassified Streptomyces TaxID=2593676 RepID=UPI002253BB45|nr:MULTISPECIES: DM13 domain-containing protein [unclassified Streptomyces]MCX4514354.1 DM13 domain-containing protein [Streptomyces sp. NBC_01619]